jgi:hypothetical protein
MRRKILYLRWIDSALTPEWSRAPNEDTGLSKIETVGHLILEDDQHIQVAQSSYEDNKYSAIQSIPKSVILERRVLQMQMQRNVFSYFFFPGDGFFLTTILSVSLTVDAWCFLA